MSVEDPDEDPVTVYPAHMWQRQQPVPYALPARRYLPPPWASSNRGSAAPLASPKYPGVVAEARQQGREAAAPVVKRPKPQVLGAQGVGLSYEPLSLAFKP